jgi:branched-chain amino acid transport system permease protein
MARTREEREAPLREEPELHPAPPVDLRRAVGLGAIGGVTAGFVSVIGMLQQFDSRPVVDGVTLAHVVLVGIPALFGYLAGSPPKQLEGFAPSERGGRNVAAGAITGLLAGVVAALFAVLFTALLGLRAVFPNISQGMIDLLTFGQGITGGSVLLVVVGAVAGSGGAALHLLADRWRKALLWGLLWVGIFGVMQTVISQVFRSSKSLGIDLIAAVFGTEPDQPILQRLVYEPGGGVKPITAIVLFLAAFGIYFWLGGGRRTIRQRVTGMEPAQRRRAAIIGGLVLLVVLAILPVVLGRFLSQVLDIALIFVLMGLGLNIVLGFAGLLDLGYVAFFAVGAYTAAVLTSPIAACFSQEQGGWLAALTSAPALATFFLAIPFVILAAAMAGIVVGTPVLRMRGDYLAIVTLGFGEIARIGFLSEALTDCFGGARGIRQTPSVVVTPLVLSILIGVVLAFLLFLVVGKRVAGRGGRGTPIALLTTLVAAVALSFIAYAILGPVLDIRPIQLDDPILFFYGILLFALLAAYVSWTLQDSRIGRAWMAMREDELVAEAMGVNIVSAKLWAFIVGAVLASLGGALFAAKIHSVFPQSFGIVVSIQVLIIVILGGMGSMRGVVVGALVLIALPNLLREFESYRFLLYGALLIFMMLKRPEGFVPSRRRAAELHEEDKTGDVWLKQAQEEVQTGKTGTKPAPAGTG